MQLLSFHVPFYLRLHSIDPQSKGFSVAHCPSNKPAEDRSAVHRSDAGATMAAAVIDGHGGWQVAEFAVRAPHLAGKQAK